MINWVGRSAAPVIFTPSDRLDCLEKYLLVDLPVVFPLDCHTATSASSISGWITYELLDGSNEICDITALKCDAAVRLFDHALNRLTIRGHDRFCKRHIVEELIRKCRIGVL